MTSQQVTNNGLGEPLTLQQTLLTKGAALTQDFKPLKKICAHLNAFHAYADDPQRAVETNHYCSHVSTYDKALDLENARILQLTMQKDKDVRQCLLYDSAEPDARLIGVEYMIAPELFDTLSSEEQKLWHSHVYEVKSGMLVMPNPIVADALWAQAEHKEMENVVRLYGKVYHLWQTDKHHKLPLGEPKLMTSFTADGQLDFGKVEERDKKFNVDYKTKKGQREDIPVPQIHPNADNAWKKN